MGDRSRVVSFETPNDSKGLGKDRNMAIVATKEDTFGARADAINVVTLSSLVHGSVTHCPLTHLPAKPVRRPVALLGKRQRS